MPQGLQQNAQSTRARACSPPLPPEHSPTHPAVGPGGGLQHCGALLGLLQVHSPTSCEREAIPESSILPPHCRLPCLTLSIVRKEELFLYTLMLITGDLQIKLTRHINGRKGTPFLLIFTCIWEHRKEVKLTEMVRGLYTIFLKEKRARVSKGDNWGKGVTRKCRGTDGR